MNEDQTRGFTWMDETSTRGLVTLPSLKVNDYETGEIYCQLLEKEYKLKTDFVNGVPTATIKIDALLVFEDRYKISNLYRYASVSAQSLDDALKNQFTKEIEKEIKVAINSLVSSDCDAIGIKENLYRHHYKQYKSSKISDKKLENFAINYKVTVRFK